MDKLHWIAKTYSPTRLHQLEVIYDSGVWIDPAKGHSRAHLKILEKTIRWIVGQSEEAHAESFIWPIGTRGAICNPQSTVNSGSNDVCYLLAFFDRTNPRRITAGPLVATMTYPLYSALPETVFQAEILLRIRKDPLIFKTTLEHQSTSLILQPLRTYLSNNHLTHYRPPFLIVIDGLDDYDDRTSQITILNGLADSFTRIFVASNIELSFSSKS
ncbi:hypothetical protein CPC08DRAFT_821003 [Agrocybe pediades]|nr:hypothetical protein CPC08DRAFT_821003 [Agrocybe pediades]